MTTDIRKVTQNEKEYRIEFWAHRNQPVLLTGKIARANINNIERIYYLFLSNCVVVKNIVNFVEGAELHLHNCKYFDLVGWKKIVVYKTSKEFLAAYDKLNLLSKNDS